MPNNFTQSGPSEPGFIERFTVTVTHWVGSVYAFGLALLVVLLWAASYPLFTNFDSWQLVINTGTTIVTFLMVFLIQRSQNKDTLALHLKLNEVVAALKGASNRLIDVEDLSEEEIRRLHERFKLLARQVEGAGRHSVEEQCEAAPSPRGRPHQIPKDSSPCSRSVILQPLHRLLQPLLPRLARLGRQVGQRLVDLRQPLAHVIHLHQRRVTRHRPAQRVHLFRLPLVPVDQPLVDPQRLVVLPQVEPALGRDERHAAALLARQVRLALRRFRGSCPARRTPRPP